MLDIILGEALENRLRVGSAQLQRCGIFDYLVILLLDQFPVAMAIYVC